MVMLYHHTQLCFQLFENGNFDVNNKECPGDRKDFEDNELHDVLNKNAARENGYHAN